MKPSKMSVATRLKLAQRQAAAAWNDEQFRRLHFRTLLWGDIHQITQDPLVRMLGSDWEITALVGARAAVNAFACDDQRTLSLLLLKYPEPDEPPADAPSA